MAIDADKLGTDIADNSPGLSHDETRKLAGMTFLAIIRAVSPKLAQASINELRAIGSETDGSNVAWWCSALADCAQLELEAS